MRASGRACVCDLSSAILANCSKTTHEKKKWENCFRIECGPFRPILCTHIHIKWSELYIGAIETYALQNIHTMKTKAYFGTPEEEKKRSESERKNERRKQIKSLNQKHKHSHTFTDQQWKSMA